MSSRGRLVIAIILLIAGALVATSRHAIGQETQSSRPGDQARRGKLTNGPEGTPVRQNPTVKRPLSNEVIQSAVVAQMQALAETYSPINNANDLPNPYTRFEPWGDRPPGQTEWGAPIGAGAGPDGLLYVLQRCFEDSCKGRPEKPIVVLDPKTGKLIRAFGDGKYAFPHGFHIDKDGNLWTGDEGNATVRKWSKDGQLLMTIGKEGMSGDGPNGMMSNPTGVVVAPDGTVFVTEGHAKLGLKSRVSVWSKDGKFVKYLGPKNGPTAGVGPQQVSAPHTIAMDKRGRLFIGDRDNNRILIWDQDGNFIAQWSQFGRPSGLYITDDDTLYVAVSEAWGPDEPGWKKGIRIGDAWSGIVTYFIQDIESMDFVHSGPEGVGVDNVGNVFGLVVRREMFERHTTPQPHPVKDASWVAPMTPCKAPCMPHMPGMAN